MLAIPPGFGNLGAMTRSAPDPIEGDEWQDWYRLTPAQRWAATERLWAF